MSGKLDSMKIGQIVDFSTTPAMNNQPFHLTDYQLALHAYYHLWTDI